ncbi:MAG: fibronectin type III domain-containing protein [Pirellulales bacterium]
MRSQSVPARSKGGAPRHGDRGRRLHAEALEPRLFLSTSGLVEVGQQPDGALSGKIVYTHGGHGYTAANTGSGAWSFQRPLLLNMIEDLGNQDQMSMFVDTLWRAGATVVPLRPVGHQTNEIVLDNVDAGVTFSGEWSDSSSTVYFGSAGELPYRFATTSLTETAFARYRPQVNAEGFYPVYAWTRSGSDRATDQLYRVQHSGGITEVTVNHRSVGNGLVYLGTYHFEAGNSGYVDISNRSSAAGNVVIADMIRFGNGMGDISRGGGISGRPREDEAGLYWVQWHVERSQGIPTSEYRTAALDSDATVSLSPRYAEFMNREQDGVLSDRVFVSFHSNAGGGRGVTALHNTLNGGDTPNQVLLARSMAQEVNDDLVAQNGQWEHSWHNRGTNVLYQAPDFNYGELNNSVINNEFDATIVETAFHDSQLDAELMRDPDVRAAIARATTQGLIRYFRALDGVTPLVMAPSNPTTVRAISTEAAGRVAVSWQAPVANSYNGDAATEYRIYVSRNGYGYDGGTVVDGDTFSHTFDDLQTTGGPYYFRIAAVNEGGESPLSEAVAAMPTDAQANVLIVAGFDRLDRQQNPTYAFGGGTLERVRPRLSNSYDYVVQMASAINDASVPTQISSTSNEAVINGSVNLADFDAVFWILGEESDGTDTFSATEQGKVATYLTGGGKLFVSGSEIGQDLDNLNNGRSFYNNTLRADFVNNDANTYATTGVAGSIFAGINPQFDNGAQLYNVDMPDVIAVQNGSTAALNYSGGTGGTAAIQYDGGAQKVVMLGFPLETVTSEATRALMIDRVLQFFALPTVPMATIEYLLDNDNLAPTYTDSGPWTLSANPGFNGGTYKFASAGNPSQATWQTYMPIAGEAEVFVIYAAGVNRPTNVTYAIDTGSGTAGASVNQTINNLQWVSLGTFEFTPGTRSVTLNAQTSSGGSFAIADAVRIVFTGPRTDVGDFNLDGVVNGRDYFAWLENAGATSATLQQGDGNFDGTVDRADLAIWQQQFGLVGPPPAGEGTVVADAASQSSLEQPIAWLSTTAETPIPRWRSVFRTSSREYERPSDHQEGRRTALLIALDSATPAAQPQGVEGRFRHASSREFTAKERVFAELSETPAFAPLGRELLP